MDIKVGGPLPHDNKGQVQLDQTSTLADQQIKESLLRVPSLEQSAHSSLSNSKQNSAFILHISEVQADPLPALYTNNSLVQRVVTDFNYEDENSARFALTQQLASPVTGSFSVAGYLSQIGQLSGETDYFHNTARTYSVTPSFASQALDSDFEKSALNPTSSFELTLKTKEGDTITLTIEQEATIPGRQTGVALLFSVEGELSEEEQAALDDFAQSIAKTADGFFATGKARLEDLSFVDRDVFSAFTLNLDQSDAGFVRYEYQVDEKTNTQSLNAEIDGYQFELSTALDSPFDIKNLESNESFQRYLSLIEEAGDAYGTDQSDIDFLKDGFSSLMLSTQGSAVNEDFNQRMLRGDDSVDGFFTGIADFNAKITSEVTRPNPQVPGEVNMMALTLGQSTNLRTFNTADGFHEVFTQTSTHELDIRQHKPPIGLTLIDFEKGNYRYEIEQYSETRQRSLERVDGLMVDLALERNIEESFSRKEVSLWEVTNHFTETRSSHSKASLNELDYKMGDTRLLLAELEVLLNQNAVVVPVERKDNTI